MIVCGKPVAQSEPNHWPPEMQQPNVYTYTSFNFEFIHAVAVIGEQLRLLHYKLAATTVEN